MCCKVGIPYFLNYQDVDTPLSPILQRFYTNLAERVLSHWQRASQLQALASDELERAIVAQLEFRMVMNQRACLRALLSHDDSRQRVLALQSDTFESFSKALNILTPSGSSSV